MTRGVAFGAPSFNAGQSLMFPAIPWHRRSLHRLDGVAPSFFLGARYGKHVVRGRSASFASVISTQNNSNIRTLFDKDGILRTAPANTTRITHRNGFAAALFEGPATNYIRHAALAGAVLGVVGAGSSLSTDMSPPSPVAGDIATTVVGIGTENGMTYVDVRITGQPTTTRYMNFSTNTTIPAVTGDKRVYSMWLRLIAGSVSNIADLNLTFAEKNNSGGNATGRPATTINIKPTIASTDRRVIARTMTAADCAYVLPFLRIPATASPIDFTLRLSMPQCEIGEFATSPIVTNGTVLTRTADLPVLHASASEITTWAFRGYVPSLIAGQQLLSGTGGAYIRGGIATPADLIFDGIDTPQLSWAAALPGSIGLVGGFGASGRRGALNGGAAKESATPPDRSRTTMFIGPSTGLATGQVIYLDELVGYILPDWPSAAGVQAQARAAA